MHWFEPAPEQAHSEGEEDWTVSRYVVDVDFGPDEWFLDHASELERFAGMKPGELRKLALGSPVQRAWAAAAAIGYFGAFEFDQYPDKFTASELYDRYGDDIRGLMRLSRPRLQR